jgi:hypothetical protein
VDHSFFAEDALKSPNQKMTEGCEQTKLAIHNGMYEQQVVRCGVTCHVISRCVMDGLLMTRTHKWCRHKHKEKFQPHFCKSNEEMDISERGKGSFSSSRVRDNHCLFD